MNFLAVLSQQFDVCSDKCVSNNELREYTGSAAQLDKPMFRRDLRVRGSDKCHLV